MPSALETGRGPRFEAPGSSLAGGAAATLVLLPDVRPGRGAWRSGLALVRVVAAGVSFAVVAVAVAAFAFFAAGPRTGTYRTLTVLTGSMRPLYPPGSVVVVTPIAATSIRSGDVITYNAPVPDRHVVTHRVVWARQHDFHVFVQTKGDANAGADPWVAEISSPTVWKLRFAIPGAGRAIVALRSPTARRFGLIVIPFFIAATWVREIWRRDDDGDAVPEPPGV